MKESNSPIFEVLLINFLKKRQVIILFEQYILMLFLCPKVCFLYLLEFVNSIVKNSAKVYGIIKKNYLTYIRY